MNNGTCPKLCSERQIHVSCVDLGTIKRYDDGIAILLTCTFLALDTINHYHFPITVNRQLIRLGIRRHTV